MGLDYGVYSRPELRLKNGCKGDAPFNNKKNGGRLNESKKG